MNSAVTGTENSQERPYFWTNVIIVSFICCYILKTLFLSSANDVKVSKTIDGGEKVNFDHPFIQICAAYVGEFIFTIGYYIAKYYVLDLDHSQSEIRFVQFFYPAFCDFMGNLFFIYGLSTMLPSVTMASKAITLPLTALFCMWSFVRINKTFNMK